MPLKYVTATEFKKYLPERRQGELSNDTSGVFDPVSETVTTALEYAEDMFESKISGRANYQMPVQFEDDKVPVSVKNTIFDIATWFLFKRREVIPDSVQQAFDVAMTWLSDVERRRVSLPLVIDGRTRDRPSERPIISEPTRDATSVQTGGWF